MPKPFNLSTGNKRKLEEPEPYVPLAQRIEQFQKRTPERYHLRSRQSQGKGWQQPFCFNFTLECLDVILVLALYTFNQIDISLAYLILVLTN